MKKQHFVFAGSFFFSLGGQILNFSLVYRLVDVFGFAPGQIGTFVALGMLFFFLGCNLYHRFGSAFNPSGIFPVAALGVFLASIPLGFAGSLGAAYASFWIIQFGTGFFWPPVMAWVAGDLGAKELNRELGRLNRCWMAGNIFGPLISGILYQWSSAASFFASSFSYFLVITLFYLMNRQGKSIFSGLRLSGLALRRETAADLPPAEAETGLSRLLDKKLDLYRWRGWLHVWCASMFVGVLASVMPLHIRDGLGYTETSAGIMLFLRCVAAFIGFTILARFTSWHFKRKWFIALQAAVMLCALFLLPAGNELLLFFVVVFVYGFFHAACYNNSIFYSGATGKNPKKNMAIHEISIGLGVATGSAGGGFVYQHFGFAGTCIALFLVLGLGLAVFLALDRKELIMLARLKNGS